MLCHSLVGLKHCLEIFTFGVRGDFYILSQNLFVHNFVTILADHFQDLVILCVTLKLLRHKPLLSFVTLNPVYINTAFAAVRIGFVSTTGLAFDSSALSVICHSFVFLCKSHLCRLLRFL